MLCFVYLFGVSIWNMSRCTNKCVLQVGIFHPFDSKTLHTEWKVYACTKHKHMKGLHILSILFPWVLIISFVLICISLQSSFHSQPHTGRLFGTAIPTAFSLMSRRTRWEVTITDRSHFRAAMHCLGYSTILKFGILL